MSDAPIIADGWPDALSPPLADGVIAVRGARVHNLANVDLDIPRDRLVVITGVSGSGKSSLALDTVFAEGQRQYIESLSLQARQFFDQFERPDVDLIEGLPPTIAIDQKRGAANPRSTVGTLTEIYDYLRLLYARLGEPECFRCGTTIRQQSAEQIRQRIRRLPVGSKAMILAPIIRGRRGKHDDVFAAIRRSGLVRVRVDGAIHTLDDPPELSPRQAHDIEAVVDRIVAREPSENDRGERRLGEAIDLALKLGGGTLVVSVLDRAGDDPQSWRDTIYSTRYACPRCDTAYEELEPRTFSFNSPYGACPACDGLGQTVGFDPDLVIDRQKSLATGGILPWRERKTSPGYSKVAEQLQSMGIDARTKFSEATPAQFERLLYGNGEDYVGLITILEKEFSTTTDREELARLEAFRGAVRCRDCQGARLRPEARSVRVGGKTIHQLCALAVGEAASFVESLAWGDQEQPIATPILREIAARLSFLIQVGVEYLTLERPADTLSGGELSRVRLASSIGSGLVGVCYVLDEPSIGLHPRDNRRLIEAIRGLQRLGNTVLVVEHDEAMMRAADWLVDVGPGAGRHGGRIVAAGPPDDVAQNPVSLTAKYLSGHARIAAARERRKVDRAKSIHLEGARGNNLKNITVDFPLGALICVSGVSGSGKSTLVSETLAPALHRHLTGGGPKPAPYDHLKGVSQIDKLILIDQSPIGRTPRSNPATYSGVFDEIRRVFAETREAKRRGYRVGRFSFNSPGGRCEMCQGFGQKKIEMRFLPDLYVTCPDCHGTRFNRATLDVRYKGRSIADVLALPADQAAEFFENIPAIARPLAAVLDVGLGYLPLGQPSTTLSGGEAQRIKLAAELARPETGRTMYILDEPTTGLHFEDTRRLVEVLSRLVYRGNTIIAIEHHLDVIRSADWVIDLGPEGGAAGGYVVAVGTPEDVAAVEASKTGRFIREAKN
jgi:excinuclease ABC subunit A